MNKNFAAIWANLAAEFPSANTEMVATPLDLEETTTTASSYPSLPRHQVLCQPEPGQPCTLWQAFVDSCANCSDLMPQNIMLTFINHLGMFP